MAGAPYDSSLTRVQPFFAALLAHDASGRSWLPSLLAASPHGCDRLGELLDNPGSVIAPLAVPTVSGRLGCFEYPVAPPRALLTWFIDHPEQLVWPAGSALSPEAVRLRRALLYDDPPRSQRRAQERARELAATRSLLSPEWWCFEAMTRLDCVLITDRLVACIAGKRTEPLSPVTDWYPKRSQLVRDLEAARELADGTKAWVTLLLSDEPLPEGTSAHLASVLADSAPHLDAAQRDELHAAYLGNLTWGEACGAVGLPLDALPDSADVAAPLGERGP